MRRMISFRDFDWLLLTFTMLICLLGVAEIYSSTYGTKFATGQGTPLYVKQIYWIMGGVLLMFFVSILNYQILVENAHWFYGASILALLAVALFGKKVLGAKRWIQLPGGQHFQPSEWVKLVLIVALARCFAEESERGANFADVVKAGAVAAVPCRPGVRAPCVVS